MQKDESLSEIHRLINVPPLREAEFETSSAARRRFCPRVSRMITSPPTSRAHREKSSEDACALAGFVCICWTTCGPGWCAAVTACCGCPANRSSSAACWSDAPTRSSPPTRIPDSLRRIFTLKLATVREGEEPTRRRAAKSEFADNEWSLVNDLADHPNRILVVASPEGGEPYAEVAHEAVFRRWDKLRTWIAAEREFLSWRSGLEAAHRAWQAADDGTKDDALLMGLGLAQAQNWMGRRADDIPPSDRTFIARSSQVAQQHKRQMQALAGAVGVLVLASLIGWISQDFLREQWRQFAVVRPYIANQVRPSVLSTAAEHALKSGEVFRECAADCPEMVVVPAGKVLMGSPVTEEGHDKAEEPQHMVAIGKPFAVSKFPVTFADWDTCATYGDCTRDVPDSGRGRGRMPVVNVNWQEAQLYAAWLSRVTGKTYRLLSESEFEYAQRGGTQTVY